MRRLATWIVALLLAAPCLAQGAEAVDLELVLSVDSSGSVDDMEFELQRAGYAEALVHPEVLQAIRSGPNKAIALSVVEWSGPGIEAEIVGWTRIGTPEDARNVARKIMAAPRTIFGGGTGIGAAIASGMVRLEASPFTSKRRVIDVSGDGFNNRGPLPETVREGVLARGIVINGLTVGDPEGWLTEYFKQYVIGGRGAFVLAARDYKDFQRAVVRKLIREIFVSDAGSVSGVSAAGSACVAKLAAPPAKSSPRYP